MKRSQPTYLDQLIGFAALILAVAVGALVVQFVRLTWPACGLCALATGVWLAARILARRRGSKALGALSRASLPYAIGLACVTALQLAYNLARAGAGTVSNAEVWLIRQTDRIDLLNRLSWWEYVAILAVLGAAGAAAPRLGLVPRFVRAARMAETVSGALATVTAFTFVTAAVGADYLADAQARFRAQLAGKERGRQGVMADTLANEAAARAVDRLPPVSVKILEAVEKQLHPTPAGRLSTAALLDLELEEQIRPHEDAPPRVKAPAAPPDEVLRGEALLRRSADEDRQAGEARRANKASAEAVAAALDRAADNAGDLARERVRDLLERLVGGDLAPLLRSMIDVGGNLTSEYLSQLREPLMRRAGAYCDRLLDGISRLGRPELAAEEIRSSARNDAIDEARRIERGEPENARFDLNGEKILGRRRPGLGEGTSYLTGVIDIAVDLTPGAKPVDWVQKLGSSGRPGGPLDVAKAASATRGPRAPSTEARADAELALAVQEVAGYHGSEIRMLEAVRARARAMEGSDRIGERVRARAEAEPREAP